MTYKLSTRITWAQTRTDLEETFRKWGVNDWNIIANITPGRADNSWQSDEECLVAVRYMHISGREVRLEMGQQRRAVDNLRVLYLAIEALRLNETRGIEDVIADAYLQLAAPANHRDPYEIMGVRSDAEMAAIDATYRALSKSRHPDHGGSNEAMTELNDAMERIRADRNGDAP